MSFNSLTEGNAPSNALTTTRLKRQLVEQAIDAATAAEWEEAARINERLLELGPDSEAENRLAKAFWEQGELATAREHYQAALALDPDQPDRGAQHQPAAHAARRGRQEDRRRPSRAARRP